MNEFTLLELVFFLGLSFVLGAFVGIQKDIPLTSKGIFFWKKNQLNDDFAGIRSFWLIALFGAIMQFLDQIFGTLVVFTLWGFILTAFFINIDYIYSVFKREKHSPASELSSVLVYFFWVLIFSWQQEIAIILAISISIIISAKQILSLFLEKVSRDEVNTTLKFATIAFIILPLLPDERFSFQTFLSFIWLNIWESFTHPIWTMTFFNPYSLWFFVVIMSAISYIWYILTRIFWSQSGILLSSVIWGMISSTAVTASMSEESKKHPHNTSLYTTGTLLASWVMFLRVIGIVGFTYTALLSTIFLPAMIMFFVFMMCTLYFYLTSQKQTSQSLSHIEEKIQSPFRLSPALKFAWLILAIKFIAGLGIIYKDIWGESLFYYTLGIISWLADVDAITQTMSADAKNWALWVAVAGTTILIAVMSNNMVKWSLAYRFWEKSFWKKVLFSFSISMLAGIIALFIF